MPLESGHKFNTANSDFPIAELHNYRALLHMDRRNHLSLYTPLLFSYVVGVYVVSAILVYNQIGCEPLDQGTLSASLPHTPTLPDSFHSFTTGAFAAASALVFIQIMDTEAKSALRCSQLYCAALINTIAFLGHLAIAMRVVSPTMNAFNREVYITRLLEWISLVPVLMFMTFCQDIRSFSDSVWMCFFVITQQMSVFTGCFANLTRNYTLAVVLLTLSCLCFCSMYIATYRMFRRMHSLQQAEHKYRVKKCYDFSASNDLITRGNDSELRVNEEVCKVENIGETTQFRLILFSTMFWTMTICIHCMGVFKLFDHSTEARVQNCLDLMSKCVLAQILCSGGDGKAGALLRLLALQENANAVFLQRIHSIFRMLPHPLQTIDEGMESLSCQILSADAKESILLIRSKCDSISDALNDVKYLQNIEKRAIDITFRRFDLRQTVRDCALAYVDVAKDNGVKLLLEIDERIPALLLGDKTRLKTVVACLILNGINMCPYPDGICIVSLKAPAEIVVHAKKFRVIFSVTDNSGLSQSQYDSFFAPRSAVSPTTFSLAPFREIVDAHFGKIDVITSEESTSIVIEVSLPLPTVNRFLSTKRGSSEGSERGKKLSGATSRSSEKSMLKTALVVDDVDTSRIVSSKVLELMGFTVDEADDGDIAIDMCDDHEYTVMLIDNKMPRVSGLTAVATLCSRGYKGIIIGLTGYVGDDDLEEFEAAGCDAVITKPLDVAELKRTLHSLKVPIRRM